MAAVTKHYCDWKDCKAERAGSKPLHVFKKSTRDASGNGSNDWHATFDLCVGHLAEFTLALIENLEGNNRFGMLKPLSPFEIVEKLQIRFEIT